MTAVLTPIDGSQLALAALPWAKTMASPGGRVILLRVVPPLRGLREARLAAAGIRSEEEARRIDAAWSSAAEADLDEAASALTGADVAVERLVAEGEPDEQIVETAARQGVDLIAMASHGRGAIGRAIFGSVADRVAHTTTIPVLIVRAADGAAAAPPIRRLLVPLDGSELAERALPVAIELARRHSLPVHVVRAVDPALTIPVPRNVVGAAPLISAEIADRLWREAESDAQETVGAALRRLHADGIAATGAVLNGSPFFAIAEASQPGDLIVLTSHGRGGIHRWLMGSVAEKLVREAPTPVLLVPAAGRGGDDDASR
jgi:nucleotide-binding universal stress UspA family protein